ncbi:hypothetical protein VTJ04DRAFT_1119 [Mycothermus thermophilus]|uniref:uncharacterized protein n=1 Tax=Humicola insolens TaxID=85995 RepID=UPI0037440ED6
MLPRPNQAPNRIPAAIHSFQPNARRSRQTLLFYTPTPEIPITSTTFSICHSLFKRRSRSSSTISEQHPAAVTLGP